MAFISGQRAPPVAHTANAASEWHNPCQYRVSIFRKAPPEEASKKAATPASTLFTVLTY